MVDWTSSMQQTFEYYMVDPGTWKDMKLLTNVKGCTINRDSTVETLGSASIDITESVGECYVRIYLITIQNGVKEKHPLGTYLVQTPSSSYDGKIRTVSMDAYTPLLELKEKSPDLGYYVPKDGNIMDNAYRLTRENVRAPVVRPSCEKTLFDHASADPSYTWCTFLRELIANADYTFDLDELGRILFAPVQDIAALQPIWTYDDSNSSILYPNVTMDHDMYGIPNVVEVIYSGGKDNFRSRVVNDDPNSPTSTVSRGREITYRVDYPSYGEPTQTQVDLYAEQVLKSVSTVAYTVTYTHAYCPVRVGDCVRLNYSRAGLSNIKAKVVSQSIKCEPGCPVTEKAVFTTKLWR